MPFHASQTRCDVQDRKSQQDRHWAQIRQTLACSQIIALQDGGPKALLTGQSLYGPCFALDLSHLLVVHVDLLQVRLMICVSHLCCGQPPSLYHFASPYAFQGAGLADEHQTSFHQCSFIYPLRLLKSPGSSCSDPGKSDPNTVTWGHEVTIKSWHRISGVISRSFVLVLVSIP